MRAPAARQRGIRCRREDRQRIAEHLYSVREWTMARIGQALGVSQRQISTDLANLEVTSKSKTHAKTASNPKGAGRPKAAAKAKTERAPREKAKRENRRGQETPRTDQARAIVRAKLEANEPISPHRLQEETGISHVTFDMAITAEVARREAMQETVAENTLSMTAKQKVEAAIQRRMRELDAAFEQRVMAEVARRIDTLVLPSWREKLRDADAIVKRRKGVLKAEQFRKVIACLHPDRVPEELKPRYTEAFHILQEKRLLLCDEKEMPTEETSSTVPRSYAAWMAAAAAAKAARKEKRGSGLRPR